MFTFACGSVEGLTLIQKRETLKALKASIKLEVETKKALRGLAADAKLKAAAEKREAAIAKAQARLEKLLAKQVGAVGAKAIKANKRPSKGVVFGAEDNAIAAAIMARKATV